MRLEERGGGWLRQRPGVPQPDCESRCLSQVDRQPLAQSVRVAGDGLERQFVGLAPFDLAYRRCVDSDAARYLFHGQTLLLSDVLQAADGLNPDATNRTTIGTSYHYRAISYENSRGNERLRTSNLGSSFVMLTDMLDPKYGVSFHHLTGYNRAFADGSAGYFVDPPYKRGTETVALSNVERVPGNAAFKYPSDTNNRNATARTQINGKTMATAAIWGDESIFEFMSMDRPGFTFP